MIDYNTAISQVQALVASGKYTATELYTIAARVSGNSQEPNP